MRNGSMTGSDNASDGVRAVTGELGHAYCCCARLAVHSPNLANSADYARSADTGTGS